jgi:peptidylprolyl isomerase
VVQAKIKDTIRVHYASRLGDGSTFDTSTHRDPLEFILGDGELIPGFEKAVLGMNPNDTKTATIPAEQAYWARRPEMVIEVDQQHLPLTLHPYVGQRLQMTQQKRRLSSPSQSRAAPCSSSLRGAPVGCRGGLGEKGRLHFLDVGRRASASDKSRFRQLGSLSGRCPTIGEFVLGFTAIVTGWSTEPHGRGPPKLGHRCGNFSV